jgi:hypothetical protein
MGSRMDQRFLKKSFSISVILKYFSATNPMNPKIIPIQYPRK